MTKLLYIKSSPRLDRSTSIAVASEFLDAYQSRHPSDTIDTIDLWDLDMPEMDGYLIDAKYAILHGLEHTPRQAEAWQSVVEIFNRFNSADAYLLGVPMWNFGIPYKLKQFIDLVTQPGLSFGYSPETGYTGLITDRPATVVYSRGGQYALGTRSESFDLQKPYIELWLQFIGFTTIQSIIAESTLDPQRAEQVKQEAMQQASTLGASFGELIQRPELVGA